MRRFLGVFGKGFLVFIKRYKEEIVSFLFLDVVWVFVWSRGSYFEIMRGDIEDDSKKYRKNLSFWCYYGVVELIGFGMVFFLVVLIGEMINFFFIEGFLFGFFVIFN